MKKLLLKERLNAKMDEKLVNDAINYWIGKPNNPLNGKTFKDIERLAKRVGIENMQGYTQDWKGSNGHKYDYSF